MIAEPVVELTTISLSVLSDVECDVDTAMPLNRDTAAVPHGTAPVLSIGMPYHMSSSFLSSLSCLQILCLLPLLVFSTG